MPRGVARRGLLLWRAGLVGRADHRVAILVFRAVRIGAAAGDAQLALRRLAIRARFGFLGALANTICVRCARRRPWRLAPSTAIWRRRLGRVGCGASIWRWFGRVRRRSSVGQGRGASGVRPTHRPAASGPAPPLLPPTSSGPPPDEPGTVHLPLWQNSLAAQSAFFTQDPPDFTSVAPASAPVLPSALLLSVFAGSSALGASTVQPAAATHKQRAPLASFAQIALVRLIVPLSSVLGSLSRPPRARTTSWTRRATGSAATPRLARISSTSRRPSEPRSRPANRRSGPPGSPREPPASGASRTRGCAGS